jgi:hypothetical protein
MNRAGVALVIAASVAAGRVAHADADADKAAALLATLAGTGTADARAQAAKDLAAVAPRAETAIAQFLARTHTSSIDDRRKVLTSIHAAVPDKSGNFHAPPRDNDDKHPEDKIDWMPALLAIDPATPGVGEIVADVAAIRALAATKDVDAAGPIVDAAFAPDTIIYRDECGRRLRDMEPYSIPALTIASQAKNEDRRRYATYQLERLDRQEPERALGAAAGDEMLRVAILDAFRTAKVREAVHVVLATVDDDSPRVRAAARAAWMGYVTGPPPPPAPKKKLVLPGGELAKKETPLWMTYRELADNDLRKLSADLLGKAYDEKEPIDLEAVSNEVFAHYDAARAKRDADAYAAAQGRAKAGDLAAATGVFDQLLAANPDRPWRAEMAGVYLAYGKQLEGKPAWRDAAAAYEKAAVLDPSPASAKDAQAAHDYALGKALEAEGKDGSAELRRAVAAHPDYAKHDEKAAEAAGTPQPRSPWLLYAAGGAGVLALVFFALGLRRRAA